MHVIWLINELQFCGNIYLRVCLLLIVISSLLYSLLVLAWVLSLRGIVVGQVSSNFCHSSSAHWILYQQKQKGVWDLYICTFGYAKIHSRHGGHLRKWIDIVLHCELHFPLVFMTSPSESTTAPPESSNIGAIVGALAAVGSVTIISISIVIIVIIVTRNHRARFDLHKEEG